MIDRKAIYFIDANIPMYAVGTEHELKAPCVEILRRLAKADFKGATDVEVLQEILHRYTALGERTRSVELCRHFPTVVADILAVNVKVMNRAMELHLEHTQLQARDSLHAAVMLEHKINHIITADRHFDGIPEIIRIDPGSLKSDLARNENETDQRENT